MPFLRPEASRSALRILHFRFSASDGHYHDTEGTIISRLSERRGQNCRYMTDYSCLSPSNSIGLIGDSLHLIPEYDSIGSGVTLSIADADSFIDFAEWAFGPEGLPHLQVLAIGDFSHKSRYELHQLLMVRKTSIKQYPEECFEKLGANASCFDRNECFDIVNALDRDTCAQIEKPDWEFLSSCPSDNLLDSPFG